MAKPKVKAKGKAEGAGLPSHSTIGASSMHRWANCPASVRMSEGISKKESDAAKEGTAAHAVAEAALIALKNGEDWSFVIENANIDADQREAVSLYIRHIDAEINFASDMGSTYVIFPEQKFNLQSIHPKLFGTSDCVIIYHDLKKIQVYDFKYGFNFVDVKDNMQLKYYGLGALVDTFNGMDIEEVETIIVQPRAISDQGAIRSQTYSAFELMEWGKDLLKFALETENPNAKIEAGDWCRYCPAIIECPKHVERALSVAKEEFRPVRNEGEKLAEYKKLIPLLEMWIKAVNIACLEACKAGTKIPGFKVVDTIGNREWRMEEKETLDFLRSNFALQQTELFNRSLKSPAQIEKLLSRDEKKKLEEAVVRRSKGEKLVEDNDKREAKTIDAASEFDIFK